VDGWQGGLVSGWLRMAAERVRDLGWAGRRPGVGMARWEWYRVAEGGANDSRNGQLQTSSCILHTVPQLS
jgi:hypothetical protein